MAFDYVFSADSHIMEKYDLWTKAIGKKWGDRLPQRVKECNGVKGSYMFTGYEYMKLADVEVEDTPDSTSAATDLARGLEEKINRSNWDPALRLKLMEMDGVAGELINPTFMCYTLRTPNARLVQDCCTVFNDYIAEYCSEDPKRLLGTAVIGMEDIGWATRELKRVAKKGLRSAIIYTDVKPTMAPYRDRAYDKFWAAAQDCEMPVVLHIITGRVRDPFTLQGNAERQMVAKMMLEVLSDVGPVLANEFIFGGIFDRFPKLQVILGEYDISWLPWFMFRLQQIQGSLGQALDIKPIKRPVDNYMHTQVWHGFVDDKYFDRSYDVAGPKRILWGSDFPHPRNTFPNTHKILKRVLAKIDAKTQADVAGLNAARLFGLTVPKNAKAKLKRAA
ncbi:MAG: amidohydrolase [Alphaproteobacteria bacterium]|nr:amidohydrolase [Alphaproteobacteria bacterium]